MKKSDLLLAMSATALVCAVPLATRAQNAGDSAELQEVVVTAERRGNDLQKTALAITAISGEDIARSGDTDISQILQNVPSLVMQNVSGGNSTQSVQGSGAPPNIAIRGLGTDGPNRAGAVAVYQDGVLMQGGGGNSYDLSRVEVLRGPQGTLYGRGATAGAVNFITNAPGKDFEASGQLQVGNYDWIGTQGVLNIPFGEDWSSRIAFNQVKHRGFFANGQSDENEFSTRAKLRFSPSDNFSLTFGGIYYNASSQSPGAVDITANPVPSDWKNALASGNDSPNAYREFSADLEANLGFANLTYIGGYQTSHSYYTSFCDCFGNGKYVVINSPYNKTATHELRLASNGDSALSWVGGVYYYHNQLQQQFRLSLAAPAVGASDAPFTTNLQHYSPSSMAAFGEVTFAFTSATRATAGLRETHDHIVQDQLTVGGPPGPPQFVDTTANRLDWKARVEHDLNDSSLVYGTVSTGYRPGAVVQGQITDIESVHAFEVGSKNRFGNKMTVNGAVFYYDYSGFQNVLSQPVTSGTPPTTTIVTTVIPIPATFYGAELEATVQLSFNDKLTFSPSYLHAKYTGSCLTCVVGMGPNATDPSPLLTDGEDVPHAPKFSVSGDYQHTFKFAGGQSLAWNLGAHYQGSAMTDFDSSNYPTQNPRFVQGSYAIVDSSLTFSPEGGKYSLTVYGRNLTDKIYKTAAANGVAGGAFFVNDPRTYGVMISAKL